MGIEWNMNLQPMVGKKVRIETIEGHVREGKLTAIRTSTFLLNGETVGIPTEAELNAEDAIPFQQITKLTQL